ncbi:A/G-specific adenine glycosylase [Tessaracoccus sp. MC1679]|uniref:A/G-specific adenine glycosylase n=1 Tax=Tessaracoccus sp. MC1679 TaxID=2760313 RepID=UPI00351CA3D2
MTIGPLHPRLAAWYVAHARDLPWRAEGVTAWGVLVSEVMCQQTPAARVAPQWVEWMERWPAPSDVATAPTADVLRAWDRLGYPRRALRLQEAARAVVEVHGGEVPCGEADLMALPGVGRYTAAAVRAFGFGLRSLVLDTNIRRVLARIDGGVEFPVAHETAAERRRAWEFVPEDDGEAALWSVSAMELGALVCTAKSPRCEECPVADACAWLAAGRPAWDGPERRVQAWEGTDRQCRGRIMAALRGHGAVRLADVAWPDGGQLEACAASLVADGLAVRTDVGLTLP